MTRKELIHKIEALSDEQFERVAPFIEADLELKDEDVDHEWLLEGVRVGLESARTEPMVAHEVVMAELDAIVAGSKKPR